MSDQRMEAQCWICPFCFDDHRMTGLALELQSRLDIAVEALNRIDQGSQKESFLIAREALEKLGVK